MEKIRKFTENIIDRYVPNSQAKKIINELNGIITEYLTIGFNINGKYVVDIYDYSRNMLVSALEDKWEVDIDTSDDFNYDFADININLINIEYCLKNHITFDQYLSWHDYSLEQYDKKEPIINLHNYIRYYKRD